MHTKTSRNCTAWETDRITNAESSKLHCSITALFLKKKKTKVAEDSWATVKLGQELLYNIYRAKSTPGHIDSYVGHPEI